MVKMETKKKKRVILGLYEQIILKGREKKLKVWAKIDTGAAKSSVDIRLVTKLGPTPILGSKIIKNTHGSSVRIITRIPTIIKGEEYKLNYTIADRSKMNYHVILGQNALKKGNYLVDPLTKEPKESERKKIWIIEEK